MKVDAYGKIFELQRENGHWVIYSVGEGKRVRENGLAIPDDYSQEKVVVFLADLLHEMATPERPDIKIIG